MKKIKSTTRTWLFIIVLLIVVISIMIYDYTTDAGMFSAMIRAIKPIKT